MKDLLLRPVAHLVWLVLFLILVERPRRRYPVQEEVYKPLSSERAAEAAKDSA